MNQNQYTWEYLSNFVNKGFDVLQREVSMEIELKKEELNEDDVELSEIVEAMTKQMEEDMSASSMETPGLDIEMEDVKIENEEFDENSIEKTQSQDIICLWWSTYNFALNILAWF